MQKGLSSLKNSIYECTQVAVIYDGVISGKNLTEYYNSMSVFVVMTSLISISVSTLTTATDTNRRNSDSLYCWPDNLLFHPNHLLKINEYLQKVKHVVLCNFFLSSFISAL